MDKSRLRRVTRAGSLAAAGGLFLLLAEVIWMVLPFVGFISLNVTVDPFFPYRGRWFNPFFRPSYHPLGAPLVGIGFAVFFGGAFQVYSAKLRGTGAVTGGLYRFVRHPQYTALCIVGLGLLLLWPRYYLLLAFVTMCFLYFTLARGEELSMTRLHGQSYRSYMEKTSAFFPGDRKLFRLRPPHAVKAVSIVKGIGLWLVTLAVVFLAALGSSAYTILHRDLPTVSVNGFVGLDRLVHSRDIKTTGSAFREFFGKRRNDARLRRDARSQELLVRSLQLLARDSRIRKLTERAAADCVFLALPLSPHRRLFPSEHALDETEMLDFYRIYIAGIERDSSPGMPTEQYFNGYLAGKQRALLISTLVSPQRGSVREVVRVQYSRPFLDFWDRTLDKMTF